MPATEEDFPTRWQWLDWWFAARWRALLTWLALAALTAAAYYKTNMFGYVMRAAHLPDFFLTRVLPAPIFSVINFYAIYVNLALTMVWFEPLVLRLCWVRGAAWLILRITAPVVFQAHYDWKTNTVALLCAAPAIPVLRGYRSQPWTCVVGVALSIPFQQLLSRLPDDAQNWFQVLEGTVWNLPLAVVLIYGTRLLKPEERGARSIAGELA